MGLGNITKIILSGRGVQDSKPLRLTGVAQIIVVVAVMISGIAASFLWAIYGSLLPFLVMPAINMLLNYLLFVFGMTTDREE